MQQLRSVKATRTRIDLVHNKVKARLGHSSVGSHAGQSHGYVNVKNVHPSFVKSLVSNLRITFDDFEFDQVNYKDCVVVRYRTVGSKGWYEKA